MDTKNLNKLPKNAVSRDLRGIYEKTGNIYLSANIVSKRANQISSELKEELEGKLKEFASENDNLEEIFENREQIEISSFYERLPKSTIIATNEFTEDKVYYRVADPKTDELPEG
jgi:DNA-directed RNA polymerase subunit K/omega